MGISCAERSIDFEKTRQEHNVDKLRKPCMGSPWHDMQRFKLISLTNQGLMNYPTKSTLYIKRDEQDLLIGIIYVDDILLTRNNQIKFHIIKLSEV